MKTAIEIGKRLSNGQKFESGSAFRAAISVELRRQGIPHSTAHYDDNGRCLTCGEIGGCPGVHTFSEIQDAARKAAQQP